VDEKDTLKDFHRALAVQATTEQIAQFSDAGENLRFCTSQFDCFSATAGTGPHSWIGC